MASIPPQRRPQHPPTERMAILELKATRGCRGYTLAGRELHPLKIIAFHGARQASLDHDRRTSF
jgi:hypothetical protein